MKLIDAEDLIERAYHNKFDSRESIIQMIKNAPIIHDRTKCGEVNILMADKNYSQGCASDFVSILVANGYEVNIKRSGDVINIEYYKPCIEFF